MKRLLFAVLLVSAGGIQLSAQEQGRALERIALALRQPPPLIDSTAPAEELAPKKVGIFTLVRPASSGEIVRLSVPVGELTTGAWKAIAAANRRSHEATARRRVQAELARFDQQRRTAP